MIIDSVAFCTRHGKRVVYDAEHFFDAWRDDSRLRARVPARSGRRRGRERDALRHQRRQPAGRGRRGDGVGRRRARRPRPGRDPHPQRRRVRGRELARRRRGRGADGPGHDQRRRASAAGTPTSSRSCRRSSSSSASSACPPERMRLLTETAHFVDEICNLSPDPDQAYVGRNAFAHKGGMHVAGVQADARTFEHLDPELVGNSRDVLISELSGKGSVLSRAERAGIDLDADAAKRARRARQGARASRLPLRGGRRLVRAGAAP